MPLFQVFGAKLRLMNRRLRLDVPVIWRRYSVRSNCYGFILIRRLKAFAAQRSEKCPERFPNSPPNVALINSIFLYATNEKEEADKFNLFRISVMYLTHRYSKKFKATFLVRAVGMERVKANVVFMKKKRSLLNPCLANQPLVVT